VLLLAGDRGLHFPIELVEETARLFPGCDLRIYEGKDDLGAFNDRRLARDVLDFAGA
jgi:hypothetical protein